MCFLYSNCLWFGNFKLYSKSSSSTIGAIGASNDANGGSAVWATAPNNGWAGYFVDRTYVGSLGVGITNPQTRLDVSGDIRLSGVIKSSNGNVTIQLG